MPSAQEARWAAELTILAAEDNRLDLPAGLHTPVIDALRAKQDEEMRVLLTLTRSSDAVVQKRAMRALGRYENRAFSATLLQFLATGPARTEAAIAVVLSLRGDPLPIDRTGQQVQMAFELLAQLGSTENTADLGTYATAIGQLPYTRDIQVRTAEAFLLRQIQRVDSLQKLRALDADFAGALETLARVHGRLSQLSPETIEWLRRIVVNRRGLYTMSSRIAAMAALISGRGMDEDTLRVAAREIDKDAAELRRLAAVALGARVVEKHFSFSRDLWGADHKVSMTPAEMKEFARLVHTRTYKDVPVDAYYGKKEKELEGAGNQFRPYFHKSLMAGENLAKGAVITKNVVFAMRPQKLAEGLSSDCFYDVVGCKTKRALKKFDPITKDVIARATC